MHVLTASSIKQSDVFLMLLAGVVVGLTIYFLKYADELSKFDFYFLPALIITLCMGVLFCCIEILAVKPKKK